jgi:ABC-type multidrug transport system ATPase subunit
LKYKVEEIRVRDVRSEVKARELGVTWKNINIEVISVEAAVNENVVSQFNFPKLLKEARHKPQLRKIIDDIHGCVKPGEMLLVLRRPGSGCTTLLNIIANHRHGYASVTGDT